MRNEAEIAVIGSLLLGSKSVNLEPDDFEDINCRDTYKAIQTIMQAGRYVDQVTVAQELYKNHSDVHLSFISTCLSQTPTSLHAEYYADIVKDASLKRQVISLGSKLSAFDGSAHEAIEQAQTLLSDIIKKATVQEIITPQLLVELAEDRYNKLTKTQPGLSTGISKLDDICGGLFKGELIIIAGRPGLGKTTLALQIAKDIAQTQNVLVCSLEMSVASLTDKLMAGITGKPANVIRRGNYSDDTLDKIMFGLGKLSEGNLYITNGARTTNKLRGYIDKMKTAYGVSAVFIDHIQMFMDKAKSRYEGITNISRELESMTKEFDIPIMALSQLSRETEKRTDKRPVLSDLRESGALEQDADAVWFLYRDSYYDDKASKESAELIIAKNRAAGVTGKIRLRWDGVKERYYQE